MNVNAIQLYVRKQKNSGSLQQALIGLVALLAGLLVVFLTFWFTYAIIWFGMGGVSAVSQLLAGRGLHLSHETRLWCSGVFVVLLFVQHFRTSPWHWGDYPRGDYSGSLPSSGTMGGLVVMLAHPGASANMVADILLSGPRLVTGAWSFFLKARQLRGLDEAGCAALLTFLAGEANAVPYEDLERAGWKAWIGQLRCFEGIRFLQKGLLMSSELRKELSTVETA
ncbi:MAG: hypothetical protein JWQ04_1565 [Pedosphaera sp.]|nr:hypothetical protein [Pedosphaera sp.]